MLGCWIGFEGSLAEGLKSALNRVVRRRVVTRTNVLFRVD